MLKAISFLRLAEALGYSDTKLPTGSHSRRDAAGIGFRRLPGRAGRAEAQSGPPVERRQGVEKENNRHC